MANAPYLLNFSSIGNDDSGFLVTTQQAQLLPFAIKRVFWVRATPADVVRGQHAHFQTEMVLISLQATAIIDVENTAGQVHRFQLDSPHQGLYVPVLHWSSIYLRPDSLLLCLASSDYAEEDYIRDYEVFRTLGVKT